MTSGSLAEVADRIWYGEGRAPKLGRLLLRPLSAAFGAAVDRRNKQFDKLLAEATSAPGGAPEMALPAISVGNLTVGGTGKTPVSSWIVSQLLELGARPAIVLRGHGDDEWRVHKLLTPEIPVITNADRVQGTRQAMINGADCVVLDDAFQHRRARRVSDVVLVSADLWRPPHLLLPSGPFREPLRSLERATAVVITAKAASEEKIEMVRAELLETVSAERLVVVSLQPGALRRWEQGKAMADSHSESLSRNSVSDADASKLQNLSAVVVSAIGDPSAFEQQLLQDGVRLKKHLRFADHHQFTKAETIEVARLAEHADGVICTLKDAVKLGPLWPRFGAPLWYLSQKIMVTTGAEVLEREIHRVLAARFTNQPDAGTSRPFNS